MSASYDVLVVGAGLAGLWCARDLARAGFRVAIADRKRDPGDQVHTTGIFVRKTFEETPLPRLFLGAPIRRVRLHGPRGATLTLESDRDEFRIGRMPELYRHLLAEAIAAGAEWLPGTSFVASVPCSSGSRVTLKSSEGRRESFTRFVVGADGARSSVARDLGLDLNDRFLVGAELVLRRERGSRDAELSCVLDPELAPGYIAWIASDSEETHVGVAGESGRFEPAEALARFAERAALQFGVDVSAPTARRGGLIPVNGVLRRIASPLGLLIGDAAGAVSPLTAGGLDACVRLTSAASRLIAEALRRSDPSLLCEFDGSSFRARFVSRLWMRRALSSVTSPLLLDAAVSLATLTPFRAVVRHVFFGRGSFPDVRFAFERASRSAEACAPPPRA